MKTAARWVLGLVVCAALLLLGVWLAVPHLVRAQLHSQGEAWLARDVQAGQISFTLWPLTLTVYELSVVAGAGDANRAPQLHIKRLHAALSWRSVARRAPVLQALEVDGPALRLARQNTGTWDIDALLAKAQAKLAEPTDSPARFALFNLQLRDGEVLFDDQAVQQQHRLHGVQLALPFLSNLPDDLNVSVQPRLAFQLGKSVVDLRAQTRPFAAERTSQLSLKLADIELGPWWAYLPKSLALPLAPQGGRLGAELQLRFTQAAGKAPDMHLTGELRWLDMRWANAAGQTPLRWQALQVQLQDVQPFARRATLNAVRLDGAELAVQRNAQGQIDVASWGNSSPAAAQAAAASGAASTAPWQLSVQAAELVDSRVLWSDASVSPALALSLESLQAQASAVQWPLAGEAPWQVSAQLAQSPKMARPAGSFVVNGSTAASGTELTLEVQALTLAAIAPYLRALTPDKKLNLAGALTGQAKLQGLGGSVPLRAQLHALDLSDVQAQLDNTEIKVKTLGWRGEASALAAENGTQIGAKGELQLGATQLRTKASTNISDDRHVSWQSVGVRPLTFALQLGQPGQPNGKPRVDIGELMIDGLQTRLTINEQGRFNFGGEADPPPAAPAPPAPPTAAQPPTAAAADFPVQLSIAQTVLKAGRVDFIDHLVKPHYSAALSELSGRIGRLSSGTREMATVDLRGRVAGTGHLEVHGAVNPTARPLAVDITARASELELAPLSSYAGKYAGFAIERGKLTLDATYRVDENGQLQASNQITLNQLTLGEAVDSPDATKLPLRFALSLLTDSQGNIDIELPISGSLNDPQFSVWGLAWRLVGNLLLKAVTSPFALFSGGANNELSSLDFLPGTATLAPSGEAGLSRVAEALKRKPALRLTLVGTAHQGADGDATAPPNPLLTTEPLRELALQRALTVRELLLAQGVPAERLFLGAEKITEDPASNAKPSVQLSLSSP